MATISSQSCKSTSSTPQKCHFLPSRAISPSDSLPLLPVFLSCMAILSVGLTTKFSPQLNDVCFWEWNTKKLKGAFCIPGSLKHFYIVPWRHPSLKANGAWTIPPSLSLWSAGPTETWLVSSLAVLLPLSFSQAGLFRPVMSLITHRRMEIGLHGPAEGDHKQFVFLLNLCWMHFSPCWT